jgi:cobalt/nickel transport system permease protein
MHIPDGFLDAKTTIATTVLAVAGVGAAMWQANRQLTPRRVPLIGVTAAFVFAAQMVNFPVGAGTSGHLLGGVLASALVGPAAAVVVITAVLLVQCFLFQDGGVSALGANTFNMAVVATLAGGMVFHATRRFLRPTFSAVLAGWLSTMLAAICCAGQLAWSGTVPWQLAFPAMTLVHALIGIGEGIITALVLAAVLRSRPELLEQDITPTRLLPAAVWTLAIVAGLTLFVSPFACSWPDGLEQVAGQLGFESKALAHSVTSAPFPDYSLSALSQARWGTALAGLAGMLVVAGLVWTVAKLLAQRKAD